MKQLNHYLRAWANSSAEEAGSQPPSAEQIEMFNLTAGIERKKKA